MFVMMTTARVVVVAVVHVRSGAFAGAGNG